MRSRCACCHPCCTATGHPYAIPFSGSGTEASIAALTRDDLLDFHRQVLRPDNVTLIVTGAVTPEQVLPLLERQFGDWKPEPGVALAKPSIPEAAPASKRRACSCSTGPARSRRHCSSAS